MTTFAGQLARIKALVAAGRPLPADLGEWTLQRLDEAVSTDYLRLRRDQLLLQAAAEIGGSLRQRAMGILEENARLQRVWQVVASEEPDLNTVRGKVHAARLILPIPAERQLRSIIKGGEG